MTRLHQIIVASWSDTIRHAILLGDGDAARCLTIAFVRRLRELNLLERER